MTLELLQTFCSKDETRQSIRAPFTFEGYTYASDGRILIQVKEIPGAAKCTLSNFQPATLIPRGEDLLPVTYPPAWETFTSTTSKCTTCDGRGKYSKCTTCDGTGECRHCGHTCDDCDGSGLIPHITGRHTCEECDGTGKIEKDFWVGLNHGKIAVNLKYLTLIHTLPDVQLLHQVSQQDKRHQSLLILFTRGIGVLMSAANDITNGHIPLTAQWPK